MRFMCCLNMFFYLKILKMSPELFVRCYTESAAAQIDYYTNAFVLEKFVCRYDDVMMFEILQLRLFYLEKSSVRNGYFNVLAEFSEQF